MLRDPAPSLPGRRYEDLVIVLLTIVAQYAVYSERPVNGSRCREGTSVMARAEQLTCGNPATHHHHLQRRGQCGLPQASSKALLGTLLLASTSQWPPVPSTSTHAPPAGV